MEVEELAMHLEEMWRAPSGSEPNAIVAAIVAAAKAAAATSFVKSVAAGIVSGILAAAVTKALSFEWISPINKLL